MRNRTYRGDPPPPPLPAFATRLLNVCNKGLHEEKKKTGVFDEPQNHKLKNDENVSLSINGIEKDT